MTKQKYNLKTDHAELKKQIKKWELKLDVLIEALLLMNTRETELIADHLEILSIEMGAINL